MIDCCHLIDALSEQGWHHAAGVPCSTFGGPIRHLEASGNYFPAPNEGLAWTYASGAQMAGRPTAVLVQNSGLGNLLNPLTSLSVPYQLPLLTLMSLRGWPNPDSDEPQHRLMGSAGQDVLKSLDIWCGVLTDDVADLSDKIERAVAQVARGRSAFLLVPRGCIGDHPEDVRASSANGPITTAEVAKAAAAVLQDGDLVLTTTGFASREMFAAGDRPGNFYMQGSMGHVSTISLGAAEAAPDRRVIVLDGDGAALMHMGAMASIGTRQPANLVHLLVDNGGYQSTGGQPTLRGVNYSELARACGYRTVLTARTADQVGAALSVNHPGPVFIVVPADGATKGPPSPRASASLSLPDVAARFTGHISG